MSIQIYILSKLTEEENYPYKLKKELSEPIPFDKMGNLTESKLYYIFETAWEICNKVGGIYTVLSTKAATVTKQYNDHYICVGPDISKEHNDDFLEDQNLYRNFFSFKQPFLKHALSLSR